MKIEDINYTIPTAQISEKDFDKEKWLRENPIDYFKLIYVLFNTAKNAPAGMSNDIVMDIAFQMMYPVTRLYIPETLYKFYSFTHDEDLNAKKIETLKNKKIYMSSIKEFNDPFDGKAFFYNPQELADIKRLSRHKGKFIDDFTQFHKGTALTENGTNCMPMWAHYANNHQGFCVAYDMKNPANTTLSGCTFPVQYTDQRLDITSYLKKYAEMVESTVDNHIAQGKKKILINDLSIVYMQLYLCNIKHSSWQYEKEFRCTTGAQAKGMPYIDAMPTAIYIGMNCSQQHRSELVAVARSLSIPVYQMNLAVLSENYTLEETLLDI